MCNGVQVRDSTPLKTKHEVPSQSQKPTTPVMRSSSLNCTAAEISRLTTNTTKPKALLRLRPVTKYQIVHETCTLSPLTFKHPSCWGNKALYSGVEEIVKCLVTACFRLASAANRLPATSFLRGLNRRLITGFQTVSWTGYLLRHYG